MDWKKGHIIGRGSTATVSAATSLISGKTFAVKSTQLAKSEFVQREQRILSTLSSPHVVSYIGYEITKEENEFIYNLLMEYLPGGTVADESCRRGGKVEEAAIGFYLCQILQGLEYLHSIEVAHCDIKPQNILIAQSGAKLADFGCARLVDTAAAAVPIGGTPMYMAPEVARGEEQGCPADIWSLGCTVIEMATGRPPWRNVTDGPASVLYRIGFCDEVPELPEFLSGEANDFSSKCLCRDPKQRWTAEQLLEHPFIAKFSSGQQFKEIAGFNSISPTSVLDSDVWRNSPEETETVDFTISSPSCSDSAAERIGRLSTSSGVIDWDSVDDDEKWVTVREDDSYSELEVKNYLNGAMGDLGTISNLPITGLSTHDSRLEPCKFFALPFNRSNFY